MAFTTVDATQSFKLRGTNQQTDTGLLYTPPSILQHAVGATPQSRTTALLEGLELGYAALHPRWGSGTTGTVGIGARLPNRLWIAGQWTLGVFVDDTTDAQDAGTSDFALESNIGSEGYVIACREKFNALSINVGTASTGGVPVRAVSYTNATGDGWTTMSNLFVQDGAGAHYAAGEQLLVFSPPAEWGKTQSGGLSSIPEGYYAIRVLGSTPPSMAVGLATAIEVFRLLLCTEGVADNASWEAVPARGTHRLPFGNGLAALFETANAGNRVTAQVRIFG